MWKWSLYGYIKLPILAENGDDYGINLSYVSTDP